MTGRTAHTALTAFALAFCLAAFVFSAWPGIDIAVSRAFMVDGEFPARSSRWIELFRQVVWDFSNVLALFSFVMMAVTGLSRTAKRVSTRVWSYIFLSYLIGPGLIVNGLLKTYWGRARPHQIDIFGGDATFTPALVNAQQCLKNCSFVSGEAAGAFTTALILSAVFASAIEGRGLRRTVHALIWTAMLAASAIRIAMGAHFLSDVIFAYLICGILMLSLYLALGMERHIPGATPANAVRDMGAIARAFAALIRRSPDRAR